MPSTAAPRRISGSTLVIWVISLTALATQSEMACIDKDVNCRSWASRGMCLSQVTQVNMMCPESCNICRGPQQRQEQYPQQRYLQTQQQQQSHLQPQLPPQQQYLQPQQQQPQQQYLQPQPQQQQQQYLQPQQQQPQQQYMQPQQQQQQYLQPQPQQKQQQYQQPQPQQQQQQYLQPQQPQQLPQRRTITNPEFDCGRPYPRQYAKGRSRIRRQIQRIPQDANIGVSQHGNTGPSYFPTIDVSEQDVICGSTVISPHFLLTAAQCVLNPLRPVRSVTLGVIDLSKVDGTNLRPEEYEVERIIVHPDYKPLSPESYNDVALIKTVRPIQFNEAVYPMCISAFKPPPNTIVTGSGWGKVNATHQTSVLQEADLYVRSSSDCEASYRQMGLEPLLKRWYPDLLQGRDVLCAGYPGRGACEGDAGGPLYFTDKSGRRFLAGITSKGLACKGANYANLPSIFISVDAHVPFIDSVLYEV